MKEYKILVCGSRDYNNYEHMYDDLLKVFTSLLSVGVKPILINGAARGADNLAASIAIKYDIEIRQFPPDWTKFGKAAGPIRNQAMVDEADIVLAYLRSDRENKGTKITMGMAAKKGIPVIEKID